jgi:HAD superfamily phosphoserine phosphatase-like hydrolase
MNALDALEPEVRRAVNEVLALRSGATAVFDADGTIWSGDVGEDFLRELIAQNRLIDPPPGDLYERYERLVPQDGARAFSLCVEWMRGLLLEDVERWSSELFAQRFVARVFPAMRGVLSAFRDAGVEVFLVSASNVWSVRAGAPHVFADPSRVLAVACPLDDRGRLTGDVLPPVTCSQGKVQAIRRVLGERRPSIAFGNSLFDREMLEHAERAVLVAPRDHQNPATRLALGKGWAVHRVDG